jgi:NitT/TauT family transport system permease protein
MTDAVMPSPATAEASVWRRLYEGHALPLASVLLALVVLWYAGAVYLNAPLVIDRYDRAGQDWTFSQLVTDTWNMDRPVLPTPDQVVVDLNKSVFQTAITSKRSLVYHAWITMSATVVGFLLGALLGIVLAVGVVHLRPLERSLLPWIIASQTIPILAIAPMIVVVLGNLGLTGLLPKAIISMYLCFFPVAIGMVKGLRAPEVLQLDLMHTYNASAAQIFWKLRWPSSVPFLFASLKVAIAISLVGAIVGELPTGAIAGLGARLLTGSYYGQTVQIWSALVMASLLGMVLVAAVGLIERMVLKSAGARA